MKLIKPLVTTIKESNPFKKIEIVGRTCYKSSSDMTEETAKKFYSGLVHRGHHAMLEHATFIFEVKGDTFNRIYSHNHKYLHFTSDKCRYLISGNLRAINESREMALLKPLNDLDPLLVYGSNFIHNYSDSRMDWEDVKLVDIYALKDLTENEFLSHFYMTFRFVCDRGVSHEGVRHRPSSFAQESTRYCNYSLGKFNGISCIEPYNFYGDDFVKSCPYNSGRAREEILKAFHEAEDHYMRLLSYGCTPQQARAVLPTGLKTELILTANAVELEHIFDLRSRGLTGSPHPDMKVVADEALTMYEVERAKLSRADW